MNKKIKAKWIAALTSGDYKQAKGKLQTPDGYCCLGVLCDLHSKATGTEWDMDKHYMDDNNSLPNEVIEWTGMEATIFNSCGGYGSNNDYLTNDNDAGQTFDQIAETIKKHF